MANSSAERGGCLPAFVGGAKLAASHRLARVRGRSEVCRRQTRRAHILADQRGGKDAAAEGVSRREALRSVAMSILGVWAAVRGSDCDLLSVAAARAAPADDPQLYVPPTLKYQPKATRHIPQGPPMEDAKEKPSLNEKAEISKTKSGMQYQDMKAGSGQAVTNGELVVAHWRVILEDGREVRDTRSEGNAVYFRAGAGQVEKGVDEAVIGMKPGGKRRVRVDSSVAFSDVDSGERAVVPNAAMVYIDLDVYKINPFGP